MAVVFLPLKNNYILYFIEVGMLFKRVFLIAEIRLHDIKNKPLAPALLSCIPLLFITFFSDLSLLPYWLAQSLSIYLYERVLFRFVD